MVKKIGLVYDLPTDSHIEEMVKAIEKSISGKFEVLSIPFDDDFMQKIKNVDFVFNLSTKGGKDSRQLHVPAILDKMGIPYTGPSARVHALCIDKFLTKLVLKNHNIPTPDFFVVPVGEKPCMDYTLTFPLIVKPSREGSAKGLKKESVVYDLDSLQKMVHYVHGEFHQPALVEEFIDGIEITCGILGNGEDLEVLPLLEIDFSHLPEGVERFYSDRVKNRIDHYLRFHCPARLPHPMVEKIENGCRKIFRLLELQDYARIDIRVKDGEYYVLEVNSLPLLVPVYSDITKMAKAAGYIYEGLILRILAYSFKRWGITG
ncbi:MAG: ATP-grasp domain-containing protein [Thermotogae bacterium]|nr:ATP-grasp domain-containing protein [Thermotogota bacterium]